jgi:hypothetical protein
MEKYFILNHEISDYLSWLLLRYKEKLILNIIKHILSMFYPCFIHILSIFYTNNIMEKEMFLKELR